MIHDHGPESVRMEEGGWKGELNCSAQLGELARARKEKRRPIYSSCLYCIRDDNSARITPADFSSSRVTVATVLPCGSSSST